jgi:hypothetical protein
MWSRLPELATRSGANGRDERRLSDSKLRRQERQAYGRSRRGCPDFVVTLWDGWTLAAHRS